MNDLRRPTWTYRPEIVISEPQKKPRWEDFLKWLLRLLLSLFVFRLLLHLLCRLFGRCFWGVAYEGNNNIVNENVLAEKESVNDNKEVVNSVNNNLVNDTEIESGEGSVGKAENADENEPVDNIADILNKEVRDQFVDSELAQVLSGELLDAQEDRSLIKDDLRIIRNELNEHLVYAKDIHTGITSSENAEYKEGKINDYYYYNGIFDWSIATGSMENIYLAYSGLDYDTTNIDFLGENLTAYIDGTSSIGSTDKIKLELDESKRLANSLGLKLCYDKDQLGKTCKDFDGIGCKETSTMICGVYKKVIDKGSDLPAAGTGIVATVDDNQTAIDLTIYKGENELADQNEIVQEFVLYDIPKRPAQDSVIGVMFKVDVNSYVTAAAFDVTSEGDISLSESIEIDSEGTGKFDYSGVINDLDATLTRGQKTINLIDLMLGSQPSIEVNSSKLEGPFQVSSVIDGDTIRINYNGRNESVRFIGIDTPELNPLECYGIDAKRGLEGLIGNQVYLEFDGSQGMRDQYDRLLAYVYNGNTNINYELVSRGFAKEHTYSSKYKYSADFKSAELYSKNNRLGLRGTCF